MKTDYLTGVLTVDEFIFTGNNILKEAKDQYAILSIDLSNFKYLNDFYSMEDGNQALVLMADTLFHKNGDCAIACRVGCDQFRALLKTNGDFDGVVEHMVSLNHQLETELKNRYPDVFLHVYTGIYLIEDNGEDIRSALDKSHLAKKKIKGNFDSICEIYTDEKYKDQLENMDAVRTFEYAMNNDKIHLFLQPKFSSLRNALVGAEALVRISDENDKLIPPGVFIPVLEQTGMIGRLDDVMFEKVFQFQADMRSQNKPLYPISVNASRIELTNPDFVNRMLELSKKYDIAPEYVEVEITETTMMSSEEDINHTLNELRKNGFKIDVDDFGSGYSSLSQITTLPADTIKLDMYFARNCIKTAEGRVVLGHIISMLHEIHYNIICEGIETLEDKNVITSLGCDQIQGYFYSKPLIWKAFCDKYYNV